MDPGVTVTGNPEGTAIVLLHSSMSSSRQWHKLVLQLQADYLLINIDLLGYGTAPQVLDNTHFGLEDETRRIEIILQQLNISEYLLVAHSYGGATALKYAYEHQPQVLAMALFEPVAFHLLDKQSQAWQEIQQISMEMHHCSDEQAAQSFVDYWNGPGFFASVPLAMQQVFSAQAKKVLLDFQGLTREAYTLEDYSQLNMPVLLMTGELSRQSSLTVASLLRARLSNVQHQAVNAGHMAPISHARQVNQLILNFLMGL